MKSIVHLLIRKVALQYVEVGRSLKMSFYLKHKNQCIDIIVYPSFWQKGWGPHKDYQIAEFCFPLKALLFASWSQLAQSDPKIISYTMEVAWRDPSPRYSTQSFAQVDIKIVKVGLPNTYEYYLLKAVNNLSAPYLSIVSSSPISPEAPMAWWWVKKTVNPYTKYQHKPINTFLALFQTTWRLVARSLIIK